MGHLGLNSQFLSLRPSAVESKFIPTGGQPSAAMTLGDYRNVVHGSNEIKR